MKVIRKNVTKKVNVFVADDNTEFLNQDDCVNYEKELNLKKQQDRVKGAKIYIVVDLNSNETIGLFSTKEKAINFICKMDLIHNVDLTDIENVRFICGVRDLDYFDDVSISELKEILEGANL